VLMHTLEAFAAALPEVQLILVLPKDQQDYWQQCCKEHHFPIAHQIADGGITRFESVLHGLQCIPPTETEAIVGVHDGVRPFVAKDVIKNCYDQAQKHAAVVPVVPVVETLRQVSTAQTVSRNDYRLVQTPQTFLLSLLRKAYQQPYQETFTDDASVVEALGHPVTLVEGNRENIKLTTPFDLIIANALTSNPYP